MAMGTFRTTVDIAWPYLRRYKRGLAIGSFCLIAKTVLAVINPILLRDGFDALLGGFEFGKLWKFGAALLVVALFRAAAQFYARLILVSISRDVEFDMRNDLFSHLVRLSPNFYQQMRTGDIMARATNDLNQVRMMLGPGVMYWAETTLTTTLAISVMASVDWQMTLIALIPAPLVSLVVVYFGQKIHKRFEKIQAQFSDISSRAQENLNGARIVRAYAQEDAEIHKFEELNRDYIKSNLGLARDTGIFYPLMQTLVGCTFLLVLWAGGWQLYQGKITLGSFVMFQTYMGMLIWPMIAFGWVINLTQRGTASLKRLREILDANPSIVAPAQPLPLEAVRGEIVFENVSACFGEVIALDCINLRIPAGTTAAIVGRTGSGKTTLLNLTTRLLDPSTGRVLIDGLDLRKLDPEQLRRHVGFVPQETFLFSTSLTENIALGEPKATEQQVRDASAKSGLADDIASFPEGYETVIGERGITLSGGQKQRTAIARAILRDPAILILDDALSSVDTVTEEKILSQLRNVMAGRTALFVSHRVSTVKDADIIFVLDQGKIVEQGKHTELIANGGYYAELYQRQALEEELEHTG
ncbi:ABC transporter ATP-binding protein [Bryobacter aggregatus]|uniref:ABC transporter ATP-binding protein n=1 Tax=Bryobacter aggregatus TaxID=360054 RepID=UPI001EE36FE8|nr:ABC transporter ATP-binding protein [Bryobacter aggregatus]